MVPWNKVFIGGVALFTILRLINGVDSGEIARFLGGAFVVYFILFELLFKAKTPPEPSKA